MEALEIVRDIIKRRYSLLPYWYGLFYDAYKTGISPMRPVWVEFPDDEETFDLDMQVHVVSLTVLICLLRSS